MFNIKKEINSENKEILSVYDENNKLIKQSEPSENDYLIITHEGFNFYCFPSINNHIYMDFAQVKEFVEKED